MAQYVEYTDGINTVRDGVRDGEYVLDYIITPLGFAGTKGIDWDETGHAVTIP